MTAVQHVLHAAPTAGNLKATPQCHCVIRTSDDIISIQPDEAELVSVPVYNPAVVYGNWAAAAYPPTAFPIPLGFVLTPGNVVGFNSAIEVALFGPIWGWGSVDWPNRRIRVDEARYAALQPGHVAFAGGVWVHETSPLRKIAHNAPSVATHHGHHAKTAAQKRFALTHSPPPPPYWWDPRYRGWGPPPRPSLPPPPPRHLARNWYDGYYYDPYR